LQKWKEVQLKLQQPPQEEAQKAETDQEAIEVVDSEEEAVVAIEAVAEEEEVAVVADSVEEERVMSGPHLPSWVDSSS
jgi:hypothetical protein